MLPKKKTIVLLISATCANQAMSQENYLLDEMVVSATKTEQSISDVAASVDLVTSQEIDDRLAQDLEQAVENEPGVSMQGTGRYGNSGFSIRGLSDNYVKTLLDGVEQPSSYNPGADVMRKYNNTIETDTLERIEINKGPSSSLYGSDALAGAVILRTKNPSDFLPKEGNATAGNIKTGYYSADDSYKATISLANRYEQFESMLIYTHRQGHETSTHSSGSDINGRDRGQADPFDINSDNLLVKTFYQLNNAHRFGITGELFNQDSKGLILSNEGYTIPMPPPMPPFVYTRNSADDRNKKERITFEHQWTANQTVADNVKWQVTQLETQTINNTFDQTDMHGYRNRYREGTDKSTQVDIQADKVLFSNDDMHEISYGLTWVNNRFALNYQDLYLEGSKAGTSLDKNGEVPNAKSEKWGAYLQDQAFLMQERLIVNAGIRYDHYDATPEGNSSLQAYSTQAVTGKLGAVYHWSETLSTYANISQGFKSPTLQDLYFYYNSGAIFEPNLDLKPEESLGYETGLRWNNDVSSLEISAFYNDYKNFIESVKIGMDGSREVWTKQNINKAHIYGAEIKSVIDLESIATLPQGTYTSASVAYAKGENSQTGTSIDSVAPLTAQWTLGYRDPNQKMCAALSVKAVAGKSGDDWSNANGVNNVTASGYTLVDITSHYHVAKDLTLRAGIFNLLDKKYLDYSDVIGVDSTTEGIDRRTQPGRNWGVEAEYRF